MLDTFLSTTLVPWNCPLALPSPTSHAPGCRICLYVRMLSHFSHVLLFETLWTVDHQTPLSMGFSKRKYRSGLSRPPPGDLPNPRTEPSSLMSPALAGGFFTNSATWETQNLSLRGAKWSDFRGLEALAL